ncbi:hypothetical protein ACFQ51_25900 [Streptomyces kaempferi]
MRVNPYFSTNVDLNPTDPAFDPAATDTYPKSDPWCTVPPNSGATKDNQQCMIDFHPYVTDMHSGALHTRRADSLWKATWDPLASPPAYKSPGPQTVGSRFVITVTDAASATRYGLQTARLRNTASTFVAPTTASLTAAASSASGAHAAEISPAKATAKGAYPLAQLVYAAVRPAKLDAAARKAYAALLTYAAGTGQVPGADPGLLPASYAPLSKALRARTTHAADALVHYTGPSATDGGSSGTSGGSGDGTGGTGGTDDSGGTTSGGATGTTPDSGGTASGGGSASPTPSGAPSYDGGKAVETTAQGTTPADPANSLRYAVPVGAALGAVAGIGAPFAGAAGSASPCACRSPAAAA